MLVPPGDIEALENALRTLTADRDRLQCMWAARPDRLRDKSWTWDGHSAQVRNLHQTAIDSQSEESLSRLGQST